MIIRNGTVLHANRLERGADVRIEGPVIAEIGVGIHAPDEQVADATGCYVLPGFIDLHTHGLRHIYVQEGGWREYAALQAEQGVTACLPTLFGPPSVVAEAMRRGRAETADLRDTPNLLDFRLEMPYLAKPGAGQASDLVAITAEATAAMWEASGGQVRLWDVSPELPGALPCSASAALSPRRRHSALRRRLQCSASGARGVWPRAWLPTWCCWMRR